MFIPVQIFTPDILFSRFPVCRRSRNNAQTSTVFTGSCTTGLRKKPCSASTKPHLCSVVSYTSTYSPFIPLWESFDISDSCCTQWRLNGSICQCQYQSAFTMSRTSVIDSFPMFLSSSCGTLLVFLCSFRSKDGSKIVSLVLYLFLWTLS